MKTIALFVHQPYCSVQSNNGIIKALSSNYNFKIFTKHQLEDNFFADVDCIAVPGGLGDASKFEMCFSANENPIKKFIKDGGKYLGICMGAYWAGQYYLDILDGVDAVPYIRQPTACTKRPHAKNLSVIWNNQPEKMFFYDGCALVGDNSKFETIATYSNGDAMAIIQRNIALIGCHPESEIHWYNSYKWMQGLYHDGRHHKLLLDFVDKFMKQ
jgi:glutamine amidotransferase-like uncharacterized protein